MALVKKIMGSLSVEMTRSFGVILVSHYGYTLRPVHSQDLQENDIIFDVPDCGHNIAVSPSHCRGYCKGLGGLLVLTKLYGQSVSLGERTTYYLTSLSIIDLIYAPA